MGDLGALGEEMHRGIPEMRHWALREHLASEGYRCVRHQ